MHAGRILLVALCACGFAAAQDAMKAMEQSVAKQMEALQKQRDSIKKQVRPADGMDSAFFTVPWKDPIPMPLPVRGPECDPIEEDQIAPLVADISEREGLTPDLLRAVIDKESAWMPCALSPTGAQGLMQLMPATAAELGVEDPFDPRQNVEGGARFLKQLMDRYGGNLVLALAAYNAGPTRVDLAGGVPDLPETMRYVSSIVGKLTAAPSPVTTQ